LSDKRLRMPVSCAQVAVLYQLDGQPCENVFYVQHEHQVDLITGFNPAAVDSGFADATEATIRAWLIADWQPNAGTDAAVTGVNIVWNTVAGVGPLEGKAYSGAPYPLTGTMVGDNFPNSVTLAISIKTAFLGRSFHGRLYFVGLNRGHVDVAAPNVVKPAASISIQAAYEGLRTTLEASYGGPPIEDKAPMGVMSFRHANADRVTGLFTPATRLALTDNFLDVQRRRLPGHNRHH
jgi:hypothetical protein